MPERGPTFMNGRSPEILPSTATGAEQLSAPLGGRDLINVFVSSYWEESRTSSLRERNRLVADRILAGYSILALPYDEQEQAIIRLNEVGGKTAARIERSISVAAQMRDMINERT